LRGRDRKAVVQGQPRQKSWSEPISKKKLTMLACVCNSSFLRIIGRRILVKATLGKKFKALSKISKARATARVVECLPTEHKALSSSLSTTYIWIGN
jgi:hypothetical protein